MTTSRVIRGPRAKVFLYVCALLIITGIIACYNNTLSQLDEIRKSNEICHQQEENLSTQLQVISEYKLRLEKSLKTEKAEHQQTKANLESRITEEKNKNENDSNDSKRKLNSLQQQFNLLQTQHEDFKEECSKTQQNQQEDIIELQSKINEMKEENKKLKSGRESLKSQYLEMQVERENLRKKLNENQVNKNENESNINHLTMERNELRRELDALKEKCTSYDTLQEPKQNPEITVIKNFNGVSKVSPPEYQIENKEPDTNVLNIQVNEKHEEKQEKSVLAVPNSNDFKSSLSKSTTKSGLRPSQGSLNGARPLLVPTVIPETINKNKVVLGVNKDYGKRKLPEGVVAIPEKKEENDQNEPPEISDNRYQNVKESANEPIADKAGKEDIEKENGAHEVFDANPAHNGMDGLAFGENDHIKNAEKQHFDKNHIDTLGVGEKERKLYEQDQHEYKDLQNEGHVGENEEDDGDDYGDALGRQMEPAVRN